MDGLRIYFDFTLPSLLLYNFERDQYNQVISEATTKMKEQNGDKMGVEAVQENKECNEKIEKEMKNNVGKNRKSVTIPEDQPKQGKSCRLGRKY